MSELGGRTAVVTFGSRPAEQTDEMSQIFRQIITDLVEGGLPPEQLADALVDAIRDGRFFVTTHPEAAAMHVDVRGQTVAGANPVMTDFS